VPVGASHNWSLDFYGRWRIKIYPGAKFEVFSFPQLTLTLATDNSLHRHLTSSCPIYFPRDVTSLVASEENEDGSDLGGLTGASEDCF
jgi:hypothetical protein